MKKSHIRVLPLLACELNDFGEPLQSVHRMPYRAPLSTEIRTQCRDRTKHSGSLLIYKEIGYTNLCKLESYKVGLST